MNEPLEFFSRDELRRRVADHAITTERGHTGTFAVFRPCGCRWCRLWAQVRNQPEGPGL